MQVLGHEDVHAHHRQAGQRVRDDGGAEGGTTEQGDVEEGIVQMALATHEQHAQHHAGGQHQQSAGVGAVFGDPLEAVHHRQHAQQRLRHAGRIQPAGVGIAILGQQLRPQQQQQHHHRHRRQEGGAPPEPFQQQAAHQRADRAADREAGDPYADRELPLVFVMEHVANQRHRRGRQGGPGHAEQGAHRDQHFRAARECRDDRSGGERGGADQQQAPPADAIAQRAHGDQEAGHQEAVDVDDPQQLRGRRIEIGADRRQRQVEHGQVHRVDHAGQGDGGQADPFAAGGLGGRGKSHGRSCAG